MTVPASIFVAALAAIQPLRPPAGEANELLRIKRIYVDKLNGGETAAQIRDLIISALQNSKLFIVTEDEERADAKLRGSAEDLVFTDKFSSSESVNSRGNSGTGRSGSGVLSKAGRYAGIAAGENESTHIEERKHEAMAAVRLVSKTGDVIWSTTQESTGAKFRGASADVAAKVTKQLADDIERAKKAGDLP